MLHAKELKIYVMSVHTELNKKPAFNTDCMFKKSNTMSADRLYV